MDFIINFWLINIDVKSNRSKEPAEVLVLAHACKKRRNNSGLALSNVGTFHTSMLVSTSGLCRKEGKILLNKLSARLTKNWEKPYFGVWRYANAHMSIAIVRAPISVSLDLVFPWSNMQPPPGRIKQVSASSMRLGFHWTHTVCTIKALSANCWTKHGCDAVKILLIWEQKPSQWYKCVLCKYMKDPKDEDMLTSKSKLICTRP